MQVLLFLQQDYYIKHQKTTKVQSMDRILKHFFFVQDKLWISPSFSAQLKIDVATFLSFRGQLQESRTINLFCNSLKQPKKVFLENALIL